MGRDTGNIDGVEDQPGPIQGAHLGQAMVGRQEPAGRMGFHMVGLGILPPQGSGYTGGQLDHGKIGREFQVPDGGGVMPPHGHQNTLGVLGTHFDGIWAPTFISRRISWEAVWMVVGTISMSSSSRC
jgi:hypothetical protein